MQARSIPENMSLVMRNRLMIKKKAMAYNMAEIKSTGLDMISSGYINLGRGSVKAKRVTPPLRINAVEENIMASFRTFSVVFTRVSRSAAAMIAIASMLLPATYVPGINREKSTPLSSKRRL
jgi:hypothetical protein